MTSAEKTLERTITRLKKEGGPHDRIRSARMRLARLRGSHTTAEWEALKAEFDFRWVKIRRAEGFE